MNRRVAGVLAAFGLALLVASCATQKGTLSWNNLTPEGKAAFALSVYNTEYDNYLLLAKKPNLTEEEKKVLRVKRKVLVALKPVLDSYATYVRSGQLPPQELERKLLDLVTQLEMERRR